MCNTPAKREPEEIGEDHIHSQSTEVLEAYDHKARGEWTDKDPRDQYTYMNSKMNSDYTLMEQVGVKDKHVLNVGCSFPIDEMWYARKILKWISVDISRETLSTAERILRNELNPNLASKFSFEYGDACALPFEDNTFDVSVSMSTFDHLPSPEARQKAVDEMARTTRRGGYVIVTVANWWNLPYALGIWKMTRDKTLHYGYAYLFSPIEIRRIGIKAGLRPVHFASSISPPHVWLPGYPFFVRYPAMVVFKLIRLWGYFGRRIGYAFVKP